MFNIATKINQNYKIFNRHNQQINKLHQILWTSKQLVINKQIKNRTMIGELLRVLNKKSKSKLIKLILEDFR